MNADAEQDNLTSPHCWAMSPNSSAKPETPLSIVGTYRLVSCTMRWSDGKEELPYGESPEGLLVYAPTGHFTGHLMQTGCTPISKRSEARHGPRDPRCIPRVPRILRNLRSG